MKYGVLMCVVLIFISTPNYARGAKTDSTNNDTVDTKKYMNSSAPELSPSPELVPQLSPIPEDFFIELDKNTEDKEDEGEFKNRYIVSTILDFDIKKLTHIDGLEVYGNFDLYEIQYIGVSIKDASIIPKIKNIEGILGITKDVERKIF